LVVNRLKCDKTLIYRYKYRKNYPFYKIFPLLNYLKIKEKCRFAAGKKRGDFCGFAAGKKEKEKTAREAGKKGGKKIRRLCRQEKRRFQVSICEEKKI